MKQEEIDRIYEMSKTQWIPCNEYMPEDVLSREVHEDYNTPRTWYSENDIDENGTIHYRNSPHQDLHYITPKVLVYRYGDVCIDFRRKFDSQETYIWNKLEGCMDDYNFYWMQIPSLPVDKLQQDRLNLEIVEKLSIDTLCTMHKSFYKNLKTRGKIDN